MVTKKSTDKEPVKKRTVGRELKAKYEYKKVILLGLEKENYSHIFILKTADGWHKIFSHSAILYKYYISPIAKSKVSESFKAPKLLADNDFRDKAPIGVMSIRELSALKEVLEKCAAKEDKSIKEADGDWVIAYKLDRKMTEKEFWAMEKEERELWGKANRLILPKVVYPNLGVDIQETTKLFYHVIRKQDRSFLDLLGRDVINSVKRLYTGLILAEKGHTDWENYFRIAFSIIAELDAAILMVSSMKLIDSNVVIRMADSIARVEEDLKNAHKNYQKGLRNGGKK